MTLTPSSDLISIDLFAGAGGLSEGLEEAGFHTLFASEIVPQYAETYARNHPSAKVCVEDIRKTDPERVRRELGLEKGQLDLVAGARPAKGSPLMRLFVPMRIPATICSVNIYAMWMPFSRVQF